MSKGGENSEHSWRSSRIKGELLYFLLSLYNRRHLSKFMCRRKDNTREGKFEIQKRRRKTGGHMWGILR